MIELYLRSRATGDRPLRAAYRIADQVVLSDVPLTAAESFSVPPPSPSEALPHAEPPAGGTLETVYRGPAWVGGRWLQMSCVCQPGGYELALEDVGTFQVAADGARVRASDPQELTFGPLLESAVLGPALLLALALRGRFSLHASAAARDGGVAAFLGRSGVGKSTLASRLEAPDWVPVADDLLPVRMTGARGAEALPRYPQLKLDRQWAPSLPPSLELGALVLLRSREGRSDGEVSVDTLGTRAAATVLARFTFVKFLFDGETLARHLGFCADLASRVPMVRVTYPRRLAAVGEIGRRVAELLDSRR